MVQSIKSTKAIWSMFMINTLPITITGNCNYEEWLQYRNDLFTEYPINDKHLRLDIEVSFPRKLLSSVPVFFNPHIGNHYDAHETFYVCDDWSPISEVKVIKDTPHEAVTLRMIVESGHDTANKLRLLSTSCTIVHEWWAAKKNWNDFAYFNGCYWKITWNEYFGEWPGGKWRGLPFQDRRYYDSWNAGGSEFELRE